MVRGWEIESHVSVRAPEPADLGRIVFNLPVVLMYDFMNFDSSALHFSTRIRSIMLVIAFQFTNVMKFRKKRPGDFNLPVLQSPEKSVRVISIYRY